MSGGDLGVRPGPCQAWVRRGTGSVSQRGRMEAPRVRWNERKVVHAGPTGTKTISRRPAAPAGQGCGGGGVPVEGKARANANREQPGATNVMRAILNVILIALQLYVWIVIASAIFSWLIAFNVVNTANRFVATVAEALWRLTEPALAPIRRYMPNLGGIDISPIILILTIFLIQRVIVLYLYPNVF